MNALVAAAESARSLVWDTEVPDIQLLSDGIAAQADALSVIFTILAIILSCVFLVQRLPVPEHDYWASWLTPTLSDVDQERERLKVLSELRAEADKKRRKKTEDLKKQVQLLLREREDLLAKQVLENEEHELQLIEARVRRNCEEEKRVKAEQRRHEKTLPDWKQIERMTSEAKRKQVEANVKEALNRRHELELKKREAELEKKRARLLAMKDEQVRNAFKYSQPEKDIDSLVKEFSDCQKDVITNKVVPVTKKKVGSFVLFIIMSHRVSHYCAISEQIQKG